MHLQGLEFLQLPVSSPTSRRCWLLHSQFRHCLKCLKFSYGWAVGSDLGFVCAKELWHNGRMGELGILQPRCPTFPVHKLFILSHNNSCPHILCPRVTHACPFLSRAAHCSGTKCNRLFTRVNSLLFVKHHVTDKRLGTQIFPDLKCLFPGKYTIPTTRSWGWP